MLSLLAFVGAKRRHLVSLLVILGLFLGAVGTALAVKPEKKFKGEIIISEKRFPSRFDSDREFIKHMKKVNTHLLVAEDEDDWEFEWMAFLPRPVAVLQASVTFYDITNPGSKTLVNTFQFYPGNKKDKILNGHSSLSMDRFESNHKYLMVFSRGYGQKPLATTKFVLRRKGEKKESNEVTFE